VKFDFKSLISRVKYLGFDTKSLNELYSLLSKKGFNYHPYLHILATLKNQTSKSFLSNSKPTAIGILLKQLEKKLRNKAYLKQEVINPDIKESNLDTEDLKSFIKETVTSMGGEVNNFNRDLLKAIENLNSNIKQIKTESEDESISRNEIDSVFINPIDEEKVDNIKANVTIEVERGDNIKSKVDRLKQLSKYKED